MYGISSPVSLRLSGTNRNLIRNIYLKKKKKKKKTFKKNVSIRSRTWPEKAMVLEVNRWTVTTKRFYTCCSGQEEEVQSTNTCKQSKFSV